MLTADVAVAQGADTRLKPGQQAKVFLRITWVPELQAVLFERDGVRDQIVPYANIARAIPLHDLKPEFFGDAGPGSAPTTPSGGGTVTGGTIGTPTTQRGASAKTITRPKAKAAGGFEPPPGPDPRREANYDD